MEAYLYEAIGQNKVRCNLCNHRCVVKNGSRGKCGVRENRNGRLESLVYGKMIARNVDPIEKKPLFHFYPGSLSYSIATVGCNFRCLFCQNSSIAQLPNDQSGLIVGDVRTPEETVASAVKNNCQSISYTYTEPTICFEFAHDTARAASKKGLKNVFVTNGYMSEEAIHMISPYLDAANVDLKAFNPDFYKTYCGARLEHVKDTLTRMKTSGVFIEVTTLLIPGLNDDRNELKAMAEFIAGSLGTDTPWHISRFHPTYKLTDRPPTPLGSLIMARKTGLDAGLRYVYTGNVPGEEGENTYCHGCGKAVIERWGFQVRSMHLDEDRCGHCGTKMDGVGLY